ncbi:MAG: gfo/Idh/MocA family oxidoreductase [Chlorobiota bacterium]|nr:MAG: gfo/Idh/MocA family oxidoreductase [Chlorobiota bacterium]
MKQPVAVAVIGCGYLGSIHARLWTQCQRAVLVGVFDIVAERASKLAAELSVRAFDSLSDALDACEAVTVATTTSQHASVACAALEKGKHVLLEKPVAATLDEAERIQEAAADAGTVVHVGHSERYNPAFRAALRYVTRPLFIEAHRLSPFRERGTDVSVIGDLMVHDLDLVLALTREPVIRIEAHGVGVISNSVDIANARLEFASGCIANLTASRLTPKPLRKLRLFQPMAYMSLDFSVPDLEVYRIDGQHDGAGTIVAHAGGNAIWYEHPLIEPGNAIAEEHRAFVASILDGAPAIVSLSDGIAALRLAAEIEQDVRNRMEQLQI